MFGWAQQLDKMIEQQENWRKNLAHQDYRKFLSEFKVFSCSNSQHLDEFCFFFHSDFKQHFSSHSIISNQTFTQYTLVYRDRRRNPYGHLNQILYLPQYCPAIQKGCKEQQCKYCHNEWEFNYHPLVFKTQQCEYFYDCAYEFCNRVHYCDITVNQKTQTAIYRFSEFFRFDILTFKTKPCKKQYGHDKNSCLYYHNPKDYRRANFEKYDHIQCKKVSGGPCHDSNCLYAHNKIEQLYHPSRYKSKFCEKHFTSRKTAQNPNDQNSFKSLCPYGKICSFAHNQSEISIQLIDQWAKNLQFYLYAYKTVWCPITTQHNRSQCVYAHNIQDYRRNPREHHYEHVQCPYWKKNENIKSIDEAGCPNGMQCTKCHGWKERQYHPMVYCKAKQNQSRGKDKSESITASDGAKDKTQSSYVKDIKSNELNNQVISKKLGAGLSSKNKIEAIVEKQLIKGNNHHNNIQRQIYAPGTPFFKNTRLDGKIKSQSEKGQVCKADIEEKTSIIEERGSLIASQNNFNDSQLTSENNPFFSPQDVDDIAIFKAFENPITIFVEEHLARTQKNQSESGQETIQKERFNRTVSRSVGCRRTASKSKFSKDVVEVLNPQILTVLEQKNISEIKLVNMREEDINKIKQLTESQKTLIIKKIIMSRGTAKKTPTYEQIFEKFFIKHKRKGLLGKMKNRKVKQEKLLLMDSEIKDLSFLTDSQKRILPEILNQFKDNKDFDSLNEDILKLVSKGAFK